MQSALLVVGVLIAVMGEIGVIDYIYGWGWFSFVGEKGGFMRLIVAMILGMAVSLNGASALAVEEMELVSFSNFGMSALKTSQMEDGKIAVRLDSAILAYPDLVFNFEDSFSQQQMLMQKLAGLFEMAEISSLVIYFEPSDCVVHPVATEIFECRSQEARLVKGVLVDFLGAEVAVSSSALEIVNTVVHLSKVETTSVHFKDAKLKLGFSGTILHSAGDTWLSAEKSDLESRVR